MLTILNKHIKNLQVFNTCNHIIFRSILKSTTQWYIFMLTIYNRPFFTAMLNFLRNVKRSGRTYNGANCLCCLDDIYYRLNPIKTLTPYMNLTSDTGQQLTHKLHSSVRYLQLHLFTSCFQTCSNVQNYELAVSNLLFSSQDERSKQCALNICVEINKGK